jgi:pseudouridine-5'-phosphate glycosidase/pseudouridine kinase
VAESGEKSVGDLSFGIGSKSDAWSKYPVTLKHQQVDKTSTIPPRYVAQSSKQSYQPGSSSPLVIIGSAAMDITSRARKQSSMETTLCLHSTTSGSVSLSPGGVGRNIAEATHRILSKKHASQTPVLVSLVGEDIVGGVLREELSRMGMRTDGLILVPEKASAVCNMVMNTEGGLITGVADMDIIESLEGKAVSFSPFTTSLNSSLHSRRLSNN